MGRRVTGHVEWRGGRWQVQATGPNGTRTWHDLPEIPQDQEELARTVGQKVAMRLREGTFVPKERAETVSEWFKRYYYAAEKGNVGRKNRGRPQASIEDRRGRFEKWIAPHLGPMPMASVKPDDLRRLVAKLDEQIRIRRDFYAAGGHKDDADTKRKPGLSAKSAASIWGEVTSGFRESCKSKIASLRVRPDDDDPTRGVLPPESGEEREQAALYPREVLALLSCPTVPLARRVTYAAAIYTGMRRGELAKVEAGDVDLEHCVIRVRGTKTAAAKRSIPIERSLRPLIEMLLAEHEARVEQARQDGTPAPSPLLFHVARADGKGGAADLAKKDLERAGLTRAELWLDDDAHMPFTFHGLRHTALTHWAVAGKDVRFLLTAGGHTDVTMTNRYVAQAATASALFGTPHPPLPACLLGASDGSAQESPKRPENDPEPQKQNGASRRIPRSSHVAPVSRVATPAGIEPALPA